MGENDQIPNPKSQMYPQLAGGARRVGFGHWSLVIDQRWVALAAVLTGTVVGTLGNNTVNVALPAIMDHFQVPLDQAIWAVTIYVLRFAVPMPAFGRLGDLVGYKRTYLVSMAILGLALLVAGLAPTFPALIGLRAVQGIANAPTLPSVMAIIAYLFPPEERGRAMGLWALANSSSHALGPVLAGFVVQHLGWQWIFILNAPIAWFGVLMIWRLVPADQAQHKESFDFAGAATLTFAALMLMFNLSQTTRATWPIEVWLGLWGGCLALAAAFVWTETTVAAPLVDLALFRLRSYAAAVAAVFLHGVCQFGLLLVMPLFLTRVQGYTGSQMGLLVFITPAVMAIIAPYAGRLADQRGARLPSVAGMAIMALAGLALTLLDAVTPAAYVVASLAVAGIGLGLLQSPAAAAVSRVVPGTRLGVALGFYNMARFIGGTLGTTLFGVLFQQFVTAGASSVDAFRWVFTVLAGVAVIAAVAATGLPGMIKPLER